MEKIEMKILNAVDALPGQIGLLAYCPETGCRIAVNEHLPLMAASVIKVPIMAEAFRQREAGVLDFSEVVTIRREDKLPSCGALNYLHDGLQVTVRDLITLMIILSDNTATNLMIEKLGQENVNAFLRKAGCTDSSLNRPLFRPDLARQGIENYVSAADMALLLGKILDKTLVSEQASEEMLRILLDQRLNGKMPFYLHQEGIRCAHKTGEDDGITHDVGIIFTQKPWIMCFLSNKTDVAVAERTIQNIAAALAGLREGEMENA